MPNTYQKNSEKEIYWLVKEKYKGKRHKNFLNDLARLKKGEPIDYIIGSAPFLNVKIDLSLRPLIPRLETEYWVEKAITRIIADQNTDRWRNIGDNLRSNLRKSAALRVLDLFAGSGAIGIAVLKNIPEASLDFGEIDKRYLKQIRINLKLNRFAGCRAKLIKTNIFGNIKDKYDYIFANPPYIAENKKSKVDLPVLKYEPHKALFGGKDGLYFLKKFFKEVRKHLKPAGQAYFEFDHSQKSAIIQYLKSLSCDFELFKDQFGYWRWGKIMCSAS